MKFIGVYATYADAEAAIDRLRDQPGFRDWTNGFSIDEYRFGFDNWTEGFVTTINILIPSRTDATAYQAASSGWRPGDLDKLSGMANTSVAMLGIGELVSCEERVIHGHGDSVVVAANVARNDA